MFREKKAQIIEELQETITKCSIGILTDYRGMSATEINDLRRQLRESGIDYLVVKNTLARFAAERAENNELAVSFEGPTAVAFGYDDISQPAKALADYIRTTRSTLMSIKGGFLGTRMLTADNVETLATLPPRDILISQVMSGMQSPIVGLVSVMAAPIRGMLGVLQARIKQLEGE
ncbi:50S ribosomal protein L10 [Chloroflexota bacterium]